MNWGSLSGEYDYINVSGQSKQWTHLLTHLISLLEPYQQIISRPFPKGKNLCYKR